MIVAYDINNKGLEPHEIRTTDLKEITIDLSERIIINKLKRNIVNSNQLKKFIDCYYELKMKRNCKLEKYNKAVDYVSANLDDLIKDCDYFRK